MKIHYDIVPRVILWEKTIFAKFAASDVLQKTNKRLKPCHAGSILTVGIFATVFTVAFVTVVTTT